MKALTNLLLIVISFSIGCRSLEKTALHASPGISTQAWESGSFMLKDFDRTPVKIRLMARALSSAFKGEMESSMLKGKELTLIYEIDPKYSEWFEETSIGGNPQIIITRRMEKLKGYPSPYLFSIDGGTEGDKATYWLFSKQGSRPGTSWVIAFQMRKDGAWEILSIKKGGSVVDGIPKNVPHPRSLFP